MKTPVIVGLTIFALLMAGCGNGSSPAETGGVPMKKKPGVRTVEVTPQPIASKIKMTGTVDSRMRTWVTAPAEGTVLSLDLREGNAVSAGSVIGYLTSTDQQNLLALAQAQYDQVAKADANGGATNVETARARLDAAKALYNPVPIVCPISGVVITKAVEPGAIVTARQQLAEIADVRQLIVKTAVPERYLSIIKTGQRVRLSVSGHDSAVAGTVSLLYPSVDVRSRTVGVEITMVSRKNLRPGMSAVVEFVIASRPSALVVPYDAVLVRPNGEKVVFTVSDSIARAHTVTTGIETNSTVEVIDGLIAGDKVIVMGQENIKDGAVVNTMNAAPQKAKGGMKK